MSNNDLQNITQKTKDRAIGTSLKPGSELRCSGRVNTFCSSTCGTGHLFLFDAWYLTYSCVLVFFNKSVFRKNRFVEARFCVMTLVNFHYILTYGRYNPVYRPRPSLLMSIGAWSSSSIYLFKIVRCDIN